MLCSRGRRETGGLHTHPSTFLTDVNTDTHLLRSLWASAGRAECVASWDWTGSGEAVMGMPMTKGSLHVRT